MEPTLFEGDWVLVNKTNYGASLPFVNIKLFNKNMPDRGDIITFVPPHTDKLYVKRVIGIPGDVVKINSKDIYVNEQLLDYRSSDHTNVHELGYETISNKEHAIQYSKDGQLPSIPVDITVPTGSYFVLGDHRTNSADSRYWGFVTENNITGKVTHTVLSLSKHRSFLDSLFMPIL